MVGNYAIEKFIGMDVEHRLRDPSYSISVLGRLLKKFLLSEHWCMQRIRGLAEDAPCKSTFYTLLGQLSLASLRGRLIENQLRLG